MAVNGKCVLRASIPQRYFDPLCPMCDNIQAKNIDSLKNTNGDPLWHVCATCRVT